MFLTWSVFLTSSTRLRQAAFAGLAAIASVVIVPGMAYATGSDGYNSPSSKSAPSYSRSGDTPSGKPKYQPNKSTTTSVKQNSAIGAVPFIQLTASNSGATTTTVRSNPIGAVTEIPLNNRNDATTTTTVPGPTTTTVVTAVADKSDDSLASTGFNATQFAGVGMILTAIGLAFLAFTGALDRTQQFVTSLIPHRLHRK